MSVRIKLKWDDNNGIETGHKIYRSQTPMSPGSLPAPLISLGANVVGYLDEAVTEGQTYYYRVGAFTDSGELVSNEVSAVAAVVYSHWIAMIGGAGADSATLSSPVIDAAGNIYAVGTTASAGAGGNDLVLLKISQNGALIWQRTLGGAAAETAGNVALDSSGNVYVCGSTASQGAGGADLLLAKFDSTGALQWQRRLGGVADDTSIGIAISSGGPIFVVGTTNPGLGGGDILLARYDTTGSLQWQRYLGSSASDAGYGVAADAAGNAYVCGFTGNSGSIDAVLAKFDSTGVLQWQRKLGSGGSEVAYGVVTDTNGGVCVVGYTDSQGGGGIDLLIARYTTSTGALQWQRSLGGTGGEVGYRVAVDSGNNIYVAGRSDAVGAGLFELVIAKYNNSGAIQWQRSLGGSNNDFGTGIALGQNGEMCVLGRTESGGAVGTDILLARLPADGSKTGVYGAFTYAPTSLTDAARTLTDVGGSLTYGSTSLTSATATLTDGAGNLTRALTPIP